MSTLSSKCDRLRWLADLYPECPILQRELRSAADIIWELRNKLAGVVDQQLKEQQ